MSTWPCIHRSTEPIRKEECPSCKGTVSIKVFTCAVHQEAQLQNYLKDVQACSLCAERVKP